MRPKVVRLQHGNDFRTLQILKFPKIATILQSEKFEVHAEQFRKTPTWYNPKVVSDDGFPGFLGMRLKVVRLQHGDDFRTLQILKFPKIATILQSEKSKAEAAQLRDTLTWHTLK